MESIKYIYSRLDKSLKEKFKKIKLIATDFDGVLTNNQVIHNQNGIESVIRSRADSQGIDLLYDAGLYDKIDYRSINHKVDIIIMSRESNPIVKSVAEKIKVKCLDSKYNKIEALEKEVQKRSLDYSEVLFIGNDINDIECMKKAGIGVAVADSFPQVLNIAGYITRKKGGEGAFREVCELILYAKEVHPCA